MTRSSARRAIAALIGSIGVVGTAAAQEALVTTDWVAKNATNPKVRIVEVSVDPGLYEKGHVQGAVGLKWHSELCDPVARDILSAEQFEKLCARSGIANDSTVVLYGDNNNWFAAWAFWQLKIYGHEDVRIMDGGRKKWLAEGRELSTDKPAFATKTYKASGPDMSLRAFLPEAVAWAYPRGRKEAAKETGLPLATFPEVCPWSLEQLQDESFLPVEEAE